MSDQIAMNSQLVRATGQWLKLYERVRFKSPFDLIQSPRRFAAFAFPHHAPMRPDSRIAADGSVDLARIAFDAPAEEGLVKFLHPAFAEMFRECAVRARRLGDDHHSRGVAVQTMDDAGAN